MPTNAKTDGASTGGCPFGGTRKTEHAEDLHTTEHAQASPPPRAEWVDPTELMNNPYPSYERLRTMGPVVEVPAISKYLVTTFEACHIVEADQSIFSADVSGATMNQALGGQPMLRKDDPDHAADRKAVNPTLRPKSVREVWKPLFERNAEHYLQHLEQVGPQQADLNRDYAAPLAAKNLIDMLGFPGEVAPEHLRGWSHDFIAGAGNVLDDPEIWKRCDASRSEVDSLLAELIPYYRRHPDRSITSMLANADLPDNTVASNVKLTISGGMNEPQHMVTNMVYALTLHPAQRDEVLNSPDLWPTAFDETLRWQSPIGMYPRQTTRETVLAGAELPEGAQLGVVVASANRDRTYFSSDPDTFDIHRPKQNHLGFGSGVHLCAGHWAARMAIGQIGVPRLYQRFPELIMDTDRETRWNGWVFRGITSLPVTW